MGTTNDAQGPPKPAVSTWPMWVLGLVIMVDQIDQNIVRGVVDQLKQTFHVNDAAIGLLLSAFVLVNGLVTVPAGYLADRWNRTRMVGRTVWGWSIITMLTAAANSFATLVGLRALLGFGQAITEPSAASLLSDYYPTSERGKVFSNQQVMGFVGFGLGIALGGAVGSAFGWRAAFLVVGPPSILVGCLAYALREPKRGYGDRLHVDADAAGAAEAGMADAVPAHLRGAGFGAFNLVSILFGVAAAPVIVGVLADIWNLRAAFLIVSPPVYIGAWILYLARDHLDADAMKIFEAVVRAMQQDEARAQQHASDHTSAENDPA